MRTFLEEVAEKIYKQHPRLDQVTIIFPNRRASLYFRKHISALLSKPAFAPGIITIEDFIAGFSHLEIPDKLTLVSILFKTYKSVMASSTESDAEFIGDLAHFYFWGEMLLRDFEEVDKYLVPAAQLFKDLSHQKELDATFDFLTEAQREFLKSFWGNFDENQSANQRRFLHIWGKLAEVYRLFKKDLLEKGLAFEGMLHRIVAEQLPVTSEAHSVVNGRSLVFAGFNALTSAEEKIISHFVEKYNAQVFWDIDAYYVNNAVQEAGTFFREYQGHAVLGKTFAPDIPSHFQNKISSGNEVELFGASQPVAQAKLMAQVLKEQIRNGINPEETLIVLPDEKLLMPVLYGIAGIVEKLNVTMGFPLGSTPLFNFIELLTDLQITRKIDHFNHRQVLAILGHPYVMAADPVTATSKRKEILRHNWVHIPKGYLATETPLHRIIFQELDDVSGTIHGSIISYLKAIVEMVGSLSSISDFDKEYAFHFLKFFNRLQTVLDDHPDQQGALSDANSGPDVPGMKTFLRLFRQLIQLQKIPFTGEPLKGLQVMGVLETRNLDFKNVFILSLNEGAFPSGGSKGSYIPHNIRQAYALPTLAHQDAMYAYLFYRVLQRADKIFLFYNSETDVLGQGEMSRYLQQLLYESGLHINRRVLHNPIQPKGISPVVVHKNQEVFKTLIRLNEGNVYFKGISPSALNTYIECRLKFYFRHVAKVREPNEVEEELDARVLGNFLHDVMERFYKDLADKKGSKLVEKSDFKNAAQAIDVLIDQVFIKAYKLDPDKKVLYAGQRLVVREVVRRFASRIVDMDEIYAPFTMEALEQEGLTYEVKIDRPPFEAILGGKIDRVDRKGELLRIIDYKTGKDELNFDSVASLFARKGRRNKAAFQTLLYALLYVGSFPDKNFKNASSAGEQTTGRPGPRVVPGLINRMNLFDEGFTFGLMVGKQQVDDVELLFPEFTAGLKNLFEELFDPAQPFDQTTETENCKFCPYTQICYR